MKYKPWWISRILYIKRFPSTPYKLRVMFDKNLDFSDYLKLKKSKDGRAR